MMYTINPQTQRGDHLPVGANNANRVMEPFYGPHQSGIETAAQGHTALLAFDLGDDVDHEMFVALMRIISDDAARLTQGQPPLADPHSSVTTNPSRLTVTFGYGVSLLAKFGLESWLPHGCHEVPPAPVHESPWSSADLLVQLSSDDEIALLHGQRAMSRNLRTHMSFRWVQRGTRPTKATLEPANNPVPGSPEFDKSVWAGKRTGAPRWMVGGTTLVVERIQTEESPLNEVPATGDSSHIAPPGRQHSKVHSDHLNSGLSAPTDLVSYQRNFAFEGEPAAFTPPDTGILRLSYQGRLDQFFKARERRNRSTTVESHSSVVGTAAFLVPPGCEYGGWVGEQLLDE